MTDLLIAERVDSYFGKFPEKDDKVPPIRKVKPENNAINPIITMMSASHEGILFFSSQETGCIQMILMKSANKIGVIIDFA
jgi:hypothetical protein